MGRYKAGRHKGVWDELLSLGAGVRSGHVYEDAIAVARETMSRVRASLATLATELRRVGYEFRFPDRVLVPAKSDARERIAELERLVGPLPLSLQAWYEMFHEVNFAGQEDETTDPLWVFPIEAAFEEYQAWSVERPPWAKFRVPIAPDALHKAEISGGMWYGIALPNAAMDAELLEEPHGIMFVDYLRLAIRASGLTGADRGARGLGEVAAKLVDF
jgi:hypothetical protein